MASDREIQQEMERCRREAEKHDKARKQAVENARTASSPAATTKYLEEAKKCKTKRDERLTEREIWRKKLTQREERQREPQKTTKQDLEKARAKVRAKAKAQVEARKTAKKAAQVSNPKAHKNREALRPGEQRMKERLEVKQKERIQKTTREALRPGEQKMKERLEQQAAMRKALEQNQGR